jgi:hypothetical protein
MFAIIEPRIRVRTLIEEATVKYTTTIATANL